MEIVYSDNLLTNGNGQGTAGWEGSVVLDKETFRVNNGTQIRQRVPVDINTEIIEVSAYFLPLHDSVGTEDIGDISLEIHYGDTSNMTYIWPNNADD